VLKWGAITFGIGVALVIVEIYFAKRKKGGIESQDKKRIWGIVWFAILAPFAVMLLYSMF